MQRDGITEPLDHSCTYCCLFQLWKPFINVGAAGLCDSQNKVVTTFKCCWWEWLCASTCYCTLHEGRKKNSFHTSHFPEVLKGETAKRCEQEGNPRWAVPSGLWNSVSPGTSFLQGALSSSHLHGAVTQFVQGISSEIKCKVPASPVAT